MLFTTEEVQQFISGLDSLAQSKVARSIDLLEKYQYHLSMPHSKMIEHNLYELRIKGKIEIRIMYTFQAATIILFYGFIKKSQKIPKQELRTIYQKYIQISHLT